MWDKLLQPVLFQFPDTPQPKPAKNRWVSPWVVTKDYHAIKTEKAAKAEEKAERKRQRKAEREEKERKWNEAIALKCLHGHCSSPSVDTEDLPDYTSNSEHQKDDGEKWEEKRRERRLRKTISKKKALLASKKPPSSTPASQCSSDDDVDDLLDADDVHAWVLH